MRVYKYQLQIADVVSVEMPISATPLHVDIQHETLCLWAKVDESETKTAIRKFRIADTGHDLDESMLGKYIGTFTIYNGSLVFHVFEWWGNETSDT